jgi:hypothetical protein
MIFDGQPADLVVTTMMGCVIPVRIIERELMRIPLFQFYSD